MDKVALKINALLKDGTAIFMNASEESLEFKAAPEKWSKKEILGHLIDSAIHNLVRFTESQYAPQPYRHRPYEQDELVRINDYQHQETEDLLVLWLSLNRRISKIISAATEQILQIPVTLSDGTRVDMRFLMADYADHLQHHLRQVERISR